MTQFDEYISHGWKICKIEPGTKGPRTEGWNRSENALVSASNVVGAGLMHAYSGTCAVDIDRLDDAIIFLAFHGIDLNAMLNAPDAVRIVSGQPNRGKLIYAMPTPLPSKTLAENALELRCGTSTGRTAQDVLPPSVHPSGNLYTWIGDWTNLPQIPETLLLLWRAEISSGKVQSDLGRPDVVRKSDTEGSSAVRTLLSRQDPDCSYHEWLKIGMAVHHETDGSEFGLALWDEWSAPGKTYPGFSELHVKWASFGRTETPVTLSYLRRNDDAIASDFEDVTAAASVISLFDDAPKASTQKKLEYHSLSLIELRSRPEPEWIIEGLLPEGEFGVMYGKHSAGKTFLACDAALSIALGRPFMGRAVKQGQIYYVAAEDNRGVGMRLGSAADIGGVLNAPIRTLVTPPVLRDKDSQRALMEELKRFSPLSVVFFDTLASVIPGADENSAKDMSEVIDFCKYISRKTKALVIVIHHETKTGGMRGSSSIPAAADVIWEVTNDPDLGIHQLTTEKVKNSNTGESFDFKLLSVGNSCAVEWL